jgi:predicted O-methyltransferase YrrM
VHLKNLLRPRYLAGRLANWVYEKRHPDHPWLAPGAIQWLDQHLHKDMLGFEWGSGRSTCWLAARLKHLTSIEHDHAWYLQVGKMLQTRQISQVELHHYPLEHPDAETYENHYPNLPHYVSAIEAVPDASLDFVLVDGWYRPVCAQAALPKLKPGAILVIDNTDWQHPPHYHVPQDWELVHESRNVMTRTSIWRKPGS